ncbi:MAG: HAD family hydrolase [Dehalococcoidia bacterium]
MPSTRFKAVLFDVGGPIDLEIEHERLVDVHIREALAELGCTPGDEEYAAAGRWAVETFAPSTYAAMIWRLADGDVDLATAVHARMSSRSVERSETRGGVELRPGIDRAINRISASGLKLGLAANQPARIIADLDRHGIGRFFGHREVSGVHGYHKPDVRLFLRACEDLSVEPEECIMVGDRIDNDIVPANLLGMATVLFRTGRHIAQQPRSWTEIPDVAVRDVDALIAALDDLIRPRQSRD